MTTAKPTPRRIVALRFAKAAERSSLRRPSTSRAQTFSLLLAIIILLLSAAPASAVVIFLKGKDEPILGRLVREDDRTVTILETVNGEDRPRILSRSDIDDMVYTVSKDRLQALSPDAPEAYRNYAEELSEKQQDPEARETALRLYLISASLAPKELGRSSMLGMINLARSAEEERRFRTLAFMIDPGHDENLLIEPSEVKAAATTSPEDRRNLLFALRYLRQGEGLAAGRLLARPGIRSELEHYKDVLTLAEVDGMASTPNSAPEPKQLRKLLALELALDNATRRVAKSAASEEAVSWKEIVLSQGVDPVPSLQLETVTEFNPTHTLYREGKWVEP